MNEEDKYNFFKLAFEIIEKRNLCKLEFLIDNTKSLIKVYRTTKREIITNMLCYTICRVLQDPLGVQLSSINNNILKQEVELFKILEKNLNILNNENKNENYWKYLNSYYSLLEIFVTIDFSRIDFCQKNSNYGRSILNTLMLNKINYDIDLSKELALPVKKGLKKYNV